MDNLALVDRWAGKVKSNEPELWLRLVQTPKLIDQIREPWGFRGVLVKFKLEVGLNEDQLLEIAEASRRQSNADLMVANTQEGMGEWALRRPHRRKVSACGSRPCLPFGWLTRSNTEPGQVIVAMCLTRRRS